MKTEDVLNGIIAKYGKTAQLNMIKEESAELIKACAELIQAVSKYERNPCFETIDHLAEEIADVEIMIEQAKIILKPEHIEGLILIHKAKKFKRMEKLIK